MLLVLQSEKQGQPRCADPGDRGAGAAHAGRAPLQPDEPHQETLLRLLLLRRRLRLHGQGHLARRLVSLPLPYC